jgi:predicted RNA polymerase sigma factor
MTKYAAPLPHDTEKEEEIFQYAFAKAMKKATPHNPNPWVIVTNAGTDDESIFSDHATYKEARQNANECGEEWDIMRRLDDGSLTTEF